VHFGQATSRLCRVQRVFSLSSIEAVSLATTVKPSKKRALEVQKAILLQIHQAQAAFLETESVVQPESTSPSASNCIVCQEALESKPFGFWSKMERVNYSKWSLIQPSSGYFYSTCGRRNTFTIAFAHAFIQPQPESTITAANSKESRLTHHPMLVLSRCKKRPERRIF
jgi:hypothetical protein